MIRAAVAATSTVGTAVRFLREVGTQATLRVYWGDDCPNTYGGGSVGCHNAELNAGASHIIDDEYVGGKPEKYGDELWPTKCDHCEAVRPSFKILAECGCCSLVTRQVFRRPIRIAQDGGFVIRPVLGDVYYVNAHELGKCWNWDDCDGKHLMAMLPFDVEFDVMSRASNCGSKNDRKHRCWVVTGDPMLGTLDVNKNGKTCKAGAGSIVIDRGKGKHWHGFIRNGRVVP